MKTYIGEVISAKTPKLAIVLVERVVRHPLYGKRVRKTKRYHVHDEKGVKTGQTIQFRESKPYSKTKRWKVIKIIKS